MSELYRWLVSNSRWHDLGHGFVGFTFGVLGLPFFIVFAVLVLFCDLFVDKHPISSVKLYFDLATKLIPSLLGLFFHYYLSRCV